MPEHDPLEGVTREHFQEARRIVDAWKKTLPAEFILGSRAMRDGEPLYPDLYFKADPDIPGLYFAKVDPDYIMGRTKTSNTIKLSKNGNDQSSGSTNGST
jgi:hypothetical protein